LITVISPNIEFYFKQFSGGERHIQITESPLAIPHKVYINADILSSNDLMDLLLLMEAVEDYYNTRIVFDLCIPYLPYARQDRVCAKGQAFSLSLLNKILNIFVIDTLTTYDVHSEVASNLFKQLDNIEAYEIIENTELQDIIKQSTLVCPDKGARDRVSKVQNISDCPMITCDKVRDPKTGWITSMEVLDENPSYPRTAVIVDDICDGGMTFILVAKELKRLGYTKIILYVTHGIFSKGLEVFDNLIDEMYTTDSFPQTDKVNVLT
jgi:ribose-phosphate pyrophosphokinase